ncbi:MAG: M23 family metallopeptidase [Caldilineaceae bacterium]|nr:M23 family metallopeptidase [Caldilineaceae bacterium]
MSYKFLVRPLEDGAYEPEGIYLSLPLAGDCMAVHFWGEQSDHYGQFSYNGVPLKGHNGIDFLIIPGTYVLAVDAGRVTEIGEEQGGLGRYLKVEHRWGESFYAHIDTILVDAGQAVARGAQLALMDEPITLASRAQPSSTYLHFGIRIKPFNRFDGWGGFVDPLPYLNPAKLLFPSENQENPLPSFLPHGMVYEQKQMRRP